MRYVVLDTETTGTVPDRDRVIWIAAAILDEDTVSERWSTLLDPGPGSRLQAGGVELAGQPTFADIEPHLTALLRRGVLVAHNAPFDVSFLAAEYRRAGRAMPDVRALCTPAPRPSPGAGRRVTELGGLLRSFRDRAPAAPSGR